MASGLRPKTSGKIGLNKSLHKRGDQDVSADIRTRRLESFCVEEQCASLAEMRESEYYRSAMPATWLEHCRAALRGTAVVA